MSVRPGPIAYLGRILPALSETFVVREIVALRRLGLTVKPFSLYPPDYQVVHPEAPALAWEVEVLIQPRRPLFWLAHLFFLIFHPRRYVRCLWRYVLAPSEPGPARLRCLSYFAAAPFTAWRLRRAGVKHLHAHFANAPATVALMGSALAGISFSFTAHAYDIFIDTLLLPGKLTAAAFVSCISEFNVRYLQRRYPQAAQARLVVVRNGVDSERFHPWPHPPGVPPLILGVGRLVETKGFHTLIEACARLRDSGLEAQCRIVGDGPEGPRLQDLIEDLGLTDRVILAGKLQPEDMLADYRRADVLAMPACVRNHDRDGIPTVLIEAMAMAIPVVATRVSGIPELVQDGQTGRLVDPDDPGALAAALNRVLRDHDEARRLAQAGRDLVVSRFNSRRSARQLLGLFAQAMASPGNVA